MCRILRILLNDDDLIGTIGNNPEQMVNKPTTKRDERKKQRFRRYRS